MVVTKLRSNGKITIKLDGKLSVTTSSQLQEILSDIFPETNNVEVDLRSLTYISSAGLRALLVCHKTAEKTGCLMTLSNVSASMQDIFDATGFTEHLLFI